MKILAIGAHADDVDLGCGGSLLRWARDGHQIVIHVATDSAYADPTGKPIRSAGDAATEARAAADFIGARLIPGDRPCLGLSFAEPLNGTLVQLVADEKPDLVFTHWEGDTHPDHKALALASLHACRRVPTVLAYRSNWYTSPQPFDARVFVDIAKTLDDKLRLIALHESEARRTGDAWPRWVRATAEDYGAVSGCAAAEGFVVIKQRLSLAGPR